MSTSPADNNRLDQIEAGLHFLAQGITIFDADLKMVAWNARFLSLLDFPTDLAFVGADYASFIRYNAQRGEYGPGDPEAIVSEWVGRARQGQLNTYERIRPNGCQLRVSSTAVPHHGFITLYTDITEQRQQEALIQSQNQALEGLVQQRTAQLENANAGLLEAHQEKTRISQALRRTESQMRLITDTIPALIAYFDNTQIYRYANRGYCEWFNKTSEQVVGNSIHEIIGIRAQDSVKHHIARALSGEQVTHEYAMLRGREKVYARSTLVPELDQNGHVVGCFVLSFDITDQKRMQAALVQAQKMEAIGQLSSGIAHDFNNLLTIIVGNLSILHEQCHQLASIENLVAPALEASKRGAQLVQRLLSFSRQQPLRPSVVNLATLINSLTPLIQRTLSSRIQLQVSLADTLMLTKVDENQLENALLNLAVNARDAMPDGGQLTITARPVILDENQGKTLDVVPGHYLNIDVSDTGIGIEPEIQHRIFEPFFTTKDFGRGSGLGLSMIYGFVKQSGGGITVISEPDHGTTMRFVLPIHTEPLEESLSPAGEEVAVRRKGELVLLVEDDADVRQVVRNQLLDLGHPVLEADNASHGMELVRNIPDISILLTDVIMPGGRNGREMAGEAKALRPELHIILMSGFEDFLKPKDDEPDFIRLSKPFSKRELSLALGQP